MREHHINDAAEVSPAALLEERLFLRVREVSKLVGMRLSSVYRAVYAGHLPSVRIGKSIRIPASAIKQLEEAARQ